MKRWFLFAAPVIVVILIGGFLALSESSKPSAPDVAGLDRPRDAQDQYLTDDMSARIAAYLNLKTDTSRRLATMRSVAGNGSQRALYLVSTKDGEYCLLILGAGENVYTCSSPGDPLFSGASEDVTFFEHDVFDHEAVEVAGVVRSDTGITSVRIKSKKKAINVPINRDGAFMIALASSSTAIDSLSTIDRNHSIVDTVNLSVG